MKRAAFAPLVLGVLAAASSLSCSAKDAPAAPTTYGLTFPSTAAAVAADEVDIQVFAIPSLTTSDVCEDLVTKVASGQALPATLADTTPIATCSLLEGSSGSINVSVGPRAFLATATHAGATLLVGCAVENVTGGQLLVPIDLALVSDTVPVPTTTCTTLSAHCKQKC